jgi:hypothetical protein
LQVVTRSDDIAPAGGEDFDGVAKVPITHMRRDIGLAWLDLKLRVPE